jgi:drug/metabolite transporter (DMT)-like permease
VFLTLCHMLACCALGGSLAAAEVMPLKRLKSSRQFHKICVLSTLFCLTIVLGNVSLKYLPVSFNQALGATTPLFTAVFALTLQGGPPGSCRQ